MVIFLNGTLNSGKTTVAEILSQKIGNCAIVEIDLFHSFVEWMDIDESLLLNYENGVDVIKNFVERGLNVIVPYPLSLDSYNNKFKDKLSIFGVDIFVITLSPKLGSVLDEKNRRKLDKWEKKRVRSHYSNGEYIHKHGIVIDNSRQTSKETANLILEKINYD